jgi:aldose 1-epimerase
MASDVPPSGRQIELVHGDQAAVVVEVGGGLRAYEVGGVAVLDGYQEHEMCSSGRGQALLPWPNRVGDGRYEWAGRVHQLALNEPERHNAIHGLARWLVWQVLEVGRSRAQVGCHLPAQPGYPWNLELRVTYSLDDDGLVVRTRASNRSAEPCPFGAGFHPYLASTTGRVDDLWLRAPAGVHYRADDRGLPVDQEDVSGTTWDFRDGRLVGPARLDDGFRSLRRGSDGRAVVEVGDPNGGRRLHLWMDGGYDHLMLYTGDTVADPRRRRQGLAVEPMTGAVDMLRSGDGLITLDPGATVEVAWGLGVTPW